MRPRPRGARPQRNPTCRVRACRGLRRRRLRRSMPKWFSASAAGAAADYSLICCPCGRRPDSPRSSSTSGSSTGELTCIRPWPICRGRSCGTGREQKGKSSSLAATSMPHVGQRRTFADFFFGAMVYQSVTMSRFGIVRKCRTPSSVALKLFSRAIRRDSESSRPGLAR